MFSVVFAAVVACLGPDVFAGVSARPRARQSCGNCFENDALHVQRYTERRTMGARTSPATSNVSR